jgi:hypothetical protein
MNTQRKSQWQAELLLTVLETELMTSEAQGKEIAGAIDRALATDDLTFAQARALRQTKKDRKKCRKRIRKKRREMTKLRARFEVA